MHSIFRGRRQVHPTPCEHAGGGPRRWFQLDADGDGELQEAAAAGAGARKPKKAAPRPRRLRYGADASDTSEDESEAEAAARQGLEDIQARSCCCWPPLLRTL